MALGSKPGIAQPKQQAAAGANPFKSAAGITKHRLIANVQGMDKTGKDHFAFTAPGPIAVMGFDVGLEGMVEKFIAQGKQIDHTEYELTVQPGEGSAQEVADAAEVVWKKFHADYHYALTHYRTAVVDTGTEAWELLRLARFGKLGQVMPHNYGPVNREFRDFVRAGFDYDCNVIWLHKMKDEWKEGKDGKGNKTGNKERSGFADIPFLVQINVQTSYDGQFHATVLNCRQNMDIAGVDFMTGQPDVLEPTFANIAAMVFGNTAEEWG